MKAINLLLLFQVLFVFGCFSQEKQINNNFSIKLYRTEELNVWTSAIIGASYNLNQKFECGLYVGYDYVNSEVELGNTITTHEYRSFKSGFDFRRYFFNPNQRVRPYLSGIVGMRRYKGKYSGYNENSGVRFEWGIYGGLKTRIYKSLSVFAEGGYGDLGIVHLGVSLDL